jgi:hypothetical protein
MSLEICFTIKGITHCWPIPVLIPQWTIPGPDPVENGSGDLTLPLQALSTITAAAEFLPEAQKAAISKVVSEATTGLQEQITAVEIHKSVRNPFRWPSSGPGPDPAASR